MMPGKQPLRQRIIVAFVLMTLLVSGGFSIAIVQIVHFVEEHLVSENLQSELDEALDALGTGRPHTLEKGKKLFTTAGSLHRPPPDIASVEKGFSEVVQRNEAFYVFRVQRDGYDYFLVQDQRDFEAREELLHHVVLAGFIGSLLIAWGLGSLLANRVMAPVRKLSFEVRSGNRIGGGEKLAAYYADDEVGRLAAAFDTTFEQLNRALEREKLFTGDVSHELRTPLMIIGSSCELLAHSPNLDHKQRDLLDRIRRAGTEMLELVNTLLLLARDTGQHREREEGVALAAMAEEQSDIWRDQFTERGIAYSCLEEGQDYGSYHATFLRTVMSNLLRNALHYTEQGSVRLVLFQGGFRVEDTGPGITPEQQSQLFQPIRRGTQSRGEGLGLGLSLVRRICEHQGWSVTMLPAQPRGCVFLVEFAASSDR